MCGNQNVTLNSRILNVGVISTVGLVKPPKITSMLKNETLLHAGMQSPCKQSLFLGYTCFATISSKKQ